MRQAVGRAQGEAGPTAVQRCAMTTIYVYLLHEGSDCWRPVDAEEVGPDEYRIVGMNRDPDDECWEFETGDVVLCERRRLSEGRNTEECLVAVARTDTTS